MNRYVLDSSAILATIQEEPGADQIEKLLSSSVVSSVNMCEVIGKLALDNIEEKESHDIIKAVVQDIIPFDEIIALTAAGMIRDTKPLGLSLGDRACLATAEHLNMEVITADKIWGKLKRPVKIRVIR